MRPSSDKLFEYQPGLFFSRLQDADDSLISQYEATQLEVIKLLEAEDFLHKTLNLLLEDS